MCLCMWSIDLDLATESLLDGQSLRNEVTNGSKHRQEWRNEAATRGGDMEKERGIDY